MTTHETEPETYVDSVLGDLSIIDCDTHFTEPPDLWTSRAPAALKDHVPVHRTVDGTTGWFFEGEPLFSLGGNTIGTGGQKVYGVQRFQTFDEIDPAAWSVGPRVELMNNRGVYAEITYPNGIGFASNHLFAIEDLSVRAAVIQIYNDFLVDVQNESKGRILPQALLPIWDIDLTVKEMERLLRKDIRGFTVTDKPEIIDLPELGDPHYDAMWGLFNESGAVANFHIGSGRRPGELSVKTNHLTHLSWESFGPQRKLSVISTQSFISNVRIITNLLMSDLFDRFPKLKVVSAESGVGWIPFLLEALEWQLDENITNSDERALQKRRPTEYFREHIYVMFWFEKSGPAKLIEDIGVKNVLVETDLPHATCLHPGARQHFADVMADWPEETRRRVLQDNAAELYRIDLPNKN